MSVDDRPFTLKALRMLPFENGNSMEGTLFPVGWPVEFAVYGDNMERQRYGPEATFGPFEYSWVYNAFCRIWKQRAGKKAEQGYLAEKNNVWFQTEDDALLAYMLFSAGIVIE